MTFILGVFNFIILIFIIDRYTLLFSLNTLVKYTIKEISLDKNHLNNLLIHLKLEDSFGKLKNLKVKDAHLHLFLKTEKEYSFSLERKKVLLKTDLFVRVFLILSYSIYMNIIFISLVNNETQNLSRIIISLLPFVLIFSFYSIYEYIKYLKYGLTINAEIIEDGDDCVIMYRTKNEEKMIVKINPITNGNNWVGKIVKIRYLRNVKNSAYCEKYFF